MFKRYEVMTTGQPCKIFRKTDIMGGILGFFLAGLNWAQVDFDEVLLFSRKFRVVTWWCCHSCDFWTYKENLLLLLLGPVSDDWFGMEYLGFYNAYHLSELWGGGGGRCAFGSVSFLGPISALLIKWLDAFVEGLSGWVVATYLLRSVSCSCSAVLSHHQIYHTFWISTKNIIPPKSKSSF